MASMPLCLCGCGKRVQFVDKGDPKRRIKRGIPRKYASHPCYLAHRKQMRSLICRTCGATKVKSGKIYRCKPCNRARLRAKKYGITFEQALTPPTRCEACHTGIDAATAHADHCHERGTFRGWLCRGCNLALGQLNEDPMQLLMLYQYLIRNKVGTHWGDAREIEPEEVFNWKQQHG